jgi:hypothetical protein
MSIIASSTPRVTVFEEKKKCCAYRTAENGAVIWDLTNCVDVDPDDNCPPGKAPFVASAMNNNTNDSLELVHGFLQSLGGGSSFCAAPSATE